MRLASDKYPRDQAGPNPMNQGRILARGREVASARFI